MPTRQIVLTDTSTQEHDRLRAQRERIAALYWHQPKQPERRVPPYAVRRQLREATLAVGRKAVARG